MELGLFVYKACVILLHNCDSIPYISGTEIKTQDGNRTCSICPDLCKQQELLPKWLRKGCSGSCGSFASKSNREIQAGLHARIIQPMAAISRSSASSRLGKHALSTGYSINTDAAKWVTRGKQKFKLDANEALCACMTKNPLSKTNFMPVTEWLPCMSKMKMRHLWKGLSSVLELVLSVFKDPGQIPNKPTEKAPS